MNAHEKTKDELIKELQELQQKLIIANKELVFQNEEKEKRVAELIIANKELNQSAELLQENLKEISDYKYALDESTIIAITDQKGIIEKANSNFCKISKYSEEELIGQDHRIINSGYHTKEFIRDLWVTIANGKIWKGELKNKAKDGNFYWMDTTIVPFLNEEGKPYQYLAIRTDITDRKEAEENLIQRTAQLGTANKELAFQNKEKEKRAAELIIANKGLAFQNDEKEKRADELGIANVELAFQNEEKEKRAAELIIANKELAFQNNEKEKRAAELIIANKELAYQNEEKEKRAAELVIANKELAFQNKLKEKRAAELIIANKELIFQNEEKEKRAAELVIANKELVFQNREKKKRAAELVIANKEMEAFSYSVSHDLSAPLRHINGYVELLLSRFYDFLPDKARQYLNKIADSASQMATLIDDLLQFSRSGLQEMRLADLDMNIIVQEVLVPIKQDNRERNIEWRIATLPHVYGDHAMLRLVWTNLLSNAVKFTRTRKKTIIEINVIDENDAFIFSIRD
ncbi:MAG: PAS domain S-box protein, partial [Bacteroidales bacterium]|nr:PAS domain S-box protein [Bacteroidales bacterium]